MIGNLVNTFIKRYLEFRFRRVERFRDNPIEFQDKWFKTILDRIDSTHFAKINGINNKLTYETFRQNVPVHTYEELYPYIEKMLKGEKDILWPGKIKWFSKSSGTTNAESKFIPVSDENLEHCHIKGPWDSMAIYVNKYPDSTIFTAKSIVMGGSLSESKYDSSIKVGDISAIMIHQMPRIGKSFSTPDLDISLMSNYEEKIELMAQELATEDIGMFGGVPTWTIVLFNRILEITGKKTMKEVWPSVEAYFHGGVGFEPYRKTFEKLIGSSDFRYQEVYNASEGYFAVQDLADDKGMLLMLDNGIFYEFAPYVNGTYDYDNIVPLSEVKKGLVYAMIITSNSGLVRYNIGDTIEFTSLNPYRIIIAGRTKQFINAFGEELMVGNVEEALFKTCEEVGGKVSEYTVAPVYLETDSKGRHEWLIEYEDRPDDISKFEQVLDLNLQNVNTDYKAKRTADLALTQLNIIPLEKGTFVRWMKKRGKYGGQNKVPRLSNDRTYIDDIINFINN